jgi:hypothetical protein
MISVQESGSTPSWVSIVPSILWFLFAVGMVGIFWRRVRVVLDAVATRIQAGAPVEVGLFSLGVPPPGLGVGGPKTATAEGAQGTDAPIDVEEMLLQRRYPEIVSEDIYLVHLSQVLQPYRGPKTGLWRVRAYVEAYKDESLLDEITRVSYRLHDSFNKNVISTESRENSFELWMNTYGEINLIAYVERKDKPPLWLTRYVDFPERPTN